MSSMKFLIPALAAAALAGCASYDDGVYAANTTTYYSAAPVYGTYYVAPPVARVQRVAPYDPNDRDGDGVPNWRDRDPNDARFR
jgi:hypothetical protein